MFVAHLEALRRSSEPLTDVQLRDMPCFTFTDARMSLREPEGGSNPGAFEAELKAFAASLPRQGVTGEEAKAMLSKQHPSFTPKAVGCISYHQVFSNMTHLFDVTRGTDETWMVRPSQLLLKVPSHTTADALDAALSTAYAMRCAQQGDSTGDWADVEPLLRSLPSEVSERVAADNIAELLPQLASFEIRADLFVRPRRRVRGAFIFVDGDGLTMTHVSAMTTRLAVNMALSNMIIVRQVAAPALTSDDIIAPLDVPSFMAVEAAAERLRRSTPLVLRDVIYLCSDTKLELYRDHVAHATVFSDAEIWVASPSCELLVHSWREDGTTTVDGPSTHPPERTVVEG